MNSQLVKRKNSVIQSFKHSQHFKIIFICSGNIIRSPYAHLLFEHLIHEDLDLRKKIKVESGGVTYRNNSISNESREMLFREGVNSDKINSFKPRYTSDFPNMFKEVDLVLVMEKNHITGLPERLREKSFIFLEFTLGLSEDVPDPYFDPPFERSFTMIKKGLFELRDMFKD
jgi:protein-tyrosine phosphatase